MTNTRIAVFTLLAAFVWPANAFAQERLERPQRRGPKHLVTITVDPEPAEIYLDDVRYGLVGTAPFKERLHTGVYRLIVKRDGYETAERIIRIARGTRHFHIALAEEVQPAEIEVSYASDANVRGAEIIVDGLPRGHAPAKLEVDEGRHLVEVVAAGFERFTLWVELEAGQDLLLDPVLIAETTPILPGALLIGSDVVGAQVFVDGTLHPETTPTLIPDLAAGAHLVEVRTPEGTPWRESVLIRPEETTKVTAQLRKEVITEGGKLTVTSNVERAEVWLDGQRRGSTPLDLSELEPGFHTVEVRAPGYAPAEERLTLSEGSATLLKLELRATGPTAKAPAPIAATTPPPVATTTATDARLPTESMAETQELTSSAEVGGTTPAEPRTVETSYDDRPVSYGIVPRTRQFSTYGAHTLPTWSFVLDLGLGYPYWLDMKTSLGILDREPHGVDASVGMRTYFTNYEIYGNARYRFVHAGPLAVAATTALAGGGGFNGRNSYSFRAGLAASLRLADFAVLSVHTFAEAWTDRLCKKPSEGMTMSSDGPSVCTANATPSALARASELLDRAVPDASALQSRDRGGRFYLSSALEAPFGDRFGGFLIVEGAPWHEERASYTNLFNRVLFNDDPRFRVLLGAKAAFY